MFRIDWLLTSAGTGDLRHCPLTCYADGLQLAVNQADAVDIRGSSIGFPHLTNDKDMFALIR
jgi:hypothetical protein